MIIIINGSPRPGGLIDQSLSLIGRTLEATGRNVCHIRIDELRVTPCRGCMSCRQTGRCTLPPDDSRRVVSLLAEAEALVIGAPCYWGNIPGQLKVLFDRMVYALMADGSGLSPKPLHRGKRALLLSTSTTPFPLNILFHQSHGAIRALKEILRWSGFRIAGTFEKGGTRRHTGLSPREERQLQKLALRLTK